MRCCASLTKLPMSRPTTFSSIPIRRWPFSRLICVGPSTAFQIGELVEGHAIPARHVDQQAAERLDRVPAFLGEAQGDVERPVLLIQARQRLAGDGQFDDPQHVARVHAVARDLVSIHGHGQVRLPGQALHDQVGAAADAPEDGRHLACLPPQHVGIVAKELEDHLGLGPGDQFVDSALNRLAEAEHHPGDVRQRVAHLARSVPPGSGRWSTARGA